MPLRKQHASLPFVRGIDQGGNDPKASAGLTVAENCVIDHRGTISKRFGKTAVGSTNYTERNIGEHKGRPVLFDGTSIRKADGSEVGSSSAFDQVDTYGVSEMKIASSVLEATSDYVQDDGTAYMMSAPEVFRANDIIFSSWVIYNTIYFRTVDANSGAQIAVRASNTTGGGATVRVVPMFDQGYAFYFYIGSLTNDVYVRPVSLTTGEFDDTWTLDLTSITSCVIADETVPIDACRLDEDTVALVYKESAADDIVIAQITFSGSNFSSSSVKQVTKADVEYVCCCRWSDTEVFVGYYTEPTLAQRHVYGAVHSTGAVTSSEVELTTVAIDQDEHINAMTCIPVGSTVVCYWVVGLYDTPDWLDSTLWHAVFTDVAGTGTVADWRKVAGHVTLWTKPWLSSDGNQVFLGVHSSHSMGSWYEGLTSADIADPQRMLCVIARANIDDSEYVCGKWMIGTADQLGNSGFARSNKAPVVSVFSGDGREPRNYYDTDDVVWYAAALEIGEDMYDSIQAQKSLLQFVSFDDDGGEQVTDFETRNEMIFPGSMPSLFDGRDLLPYGLLMAPPKPELEITAGGTTAFKDSPTSSQVLTGLHTYAACYEVTDGGGNVWRSPMSPVSSIEVSEDDQVNVTVRYYRLPWVNQLYLSGNIHIVVFRSFTGGSKDLRRWVSLPNLETTVSLTLDDDGYVVAGNGQEYSLAGAVLGDNQPPPFDIATVWKSRVFVVHQQFPDRLIRFSKEQVEGYGHGFPPSFYIDVTPRYGNITALEALDDKLVIFKRNAVMATSGRGPTDTGEHYGYAPPFLLADGIGCKSQRSVVTTPAGVLFESDDSIMILRRNGGVEPVGRSVKWLTDGTSIQAATANARDNSVYFFLADGKTLVYNYLFNAWTTWDNCGADDAVTIDGVVYFKEQGSNKVFFIDESSYLDEGTTWVTMRVRTSLINLAGLFRSKRIWEYFLEGYAHGTITLTIRIAYEGDPVWIDELTMDTEALAKWDWSKYFESAYEDEDTHGDQNLTLRWRGSRTRDEQFIQIEIEDADLDDQVVLWLMDAGTDNNVPEEVDDDLELEPYGGGE